MKKSRFQHPLARRVNHLWQAALVYFFIGSFWILPLPVSSAIGGWIGREIGPRLGVSRRARKNLDYIFPDMSDAEKEKIIEQMWDNLGRVCAETPHTKELGNLNRIQVEGREHLQKAMDSKRPIMIVSGHLANWEAGPMVMQSLGLSVAGIYRRPNNLYVDALVRYLRRYVATTFFAKGPEGARGMLRWLREGKAVGLLVDQKMNEGVALDFMGKPAMTGTAPAQIALKTDTIILPAHVVRLKGCQFKAFIHPPLEWDRTLSKDDQMINVAQAMNDFLGTAIRQNPGQWLWLHRRWIES